MAKIIFLGTAASIPSKERDNTSFIFTQKKELFLVECPGAVVHKLWKVNIDFKKIKNVIITHHHPDHFYGITHLIHAQAYLNSKLNIFTNKPALNLIKKIIRLAGLNKPPYPKLTFYDVFTKNPFYQSKQLRITAIPNKHIPFSFGIKFSYGQNLFYSSDTALSKKIIKEASYCDYVIHDCTASSYYFKRYPQLYKMHTEALALGKAFKNTGIKKLIPVHFLLLTKGEEKRIKKELASLKEKIVFPSDFDILSL